MQKGGWIFFSCWGETSIRLIASTSWWTKHHSCLPVLILLLFGCLMWTCLVNRSQPNECLQTISTCQSKNSWHILSQKNDADVARYNFDADQPILIIFEMLLRGYAIKRWFVIPPLLTNVSALLGKHEPRKLCLFSHAVYRVSKTKWLGEK